MTENELFELVNSKITLKSCKIFQDVKTKKSKCFGFLEFHNIVDCKLFFQTSKDLFIQEQRINLEFTKTDPDEIEISAWSSFYKDETDGITGYTFDEKTNYYFHPKLQYYFDPSSGFYFHSILQYWMYFDYTVKKYIKYDEKDKEIIKEKVIENMKRWKERLEVKEEKKVWTKEEEQKVIQKSLEMNQMKKKPKNRKEEKNKIQKLLNMNEEAVKMYKSGELFKKKEKEIPNSKGSKMLKNLGWKQGEGLGKSGSGIKEPIKVEIRDARLGLGFKTDKVYVGETSQQIISKKLKSKSENLD